MKQITVLLLFLSIAILSKAQVWEEAKAMSKGVNNALVVEIADADMKMIEKEWTKKLKGYNAKVKRNRKTGEIFADNATVTSISENTMDIYSSVSSTDSIYIMAVWFDMGGAYLNSSEHTDAYMLASQILTEFSVETQSLAISDELKAEEKILDKEEGSLKKLVTENEALKANIELYKKKILEAEEALKVNESNQVKKQDAINVQKNAVEEVKRRLGNVGN